MASQGTVPLETARLILRPFESTDGPAMYKNWTGDPEVTKFLTWPTHPSPEVSGQLAAYWAEKAKEEDGYQWAIVPKTLGEPIGSIAVVRQNKETRCCEVGYCIGRAWWGQGIMTEAVKAVIRYLVDERNINRVEACHDVRNPASGRVMKKAGMAFEGIHRQAGKNNLGLCDLAVYAVLAQDVRRE